MNATEHALLMEHEGCFKCRRFYVTHKSTDYPEGFPDKSLYSTLTEADALSTKKHLQKIGKTHTAAVVSPPVVAAVNTMTTVAAVVMPSAVLGDGSNSEYVLAPFFEPHLFFKCLVGGSTASFARCKLPQPKEVIMAIGDGHKIFTFDEWVPIAVISSDQSWTSCTVHAIIAPNLSVPLLLGSPFLSFNSLVIDHQLRTCIHKSSGYDLLNPQHIPRKITKPNPRFGPELWKLQKAVVKDISNLFPTTASKLDNSAALAVPCPLAAVRSCIEQIVTDDALHNKGEDLKHKYIDIFPPDIPDVIVSYAHSRRRGRDR